MSHLESANNSVIVLSIFVVVSSLPSVQVKSMEPVLKVAILNLQLLVVYLNRAVNTQTCVLHVHAYLCAY